MLLARESSSPSFLPLFAPLNLVSSRSVFVVTDTSFPPTLLDEKLVASRSRSPFASSFAFAFRCFLIPPPFFLFSLPTYGLSRTWTCSLFHLSSFAQPIVFLSHSSFSLKRSRSSSSFRTDLPTFPCLLAFHFGPYLSSGRTFFYDALHLRLTSPGLRKEMGGERERKRDFASDASVLVVRLFDGRSPLSGLTRSINGTARYRTTHQVARLEIYSAEREIED